MPKPKNDHPIVFAEFPDWSKLAKSEKNAVYDEMCQLWRNSEHDKAEQVFTYLFEHGYDERKLNEFAEAAGGDFQLFYARKWTDILADGDLAKARRWLKKAAENGSSDARMKLEFQELDGALVGTAAELLQEINEAITEAFYKKHEDEPGEIFMGETCAVLEENGHVGFVQKEVPMWDAVNGARGLILAKDEPVERSKFKMTGFSPALKAVMKKLADAADESSCYPNIIPGNLFDDILEAEDFQGECETWKILMQLLAHGYSLVSMQEYTMTNSQMLPESIRDRIEEFRGHALRSLLASADDDEKDGDDDDEIVFDLDDEDFDSDSEDVDEDADEDAPKKKKKK